MYQVKLIILGLLLICISPASAWWNNDYENRREIQINNTLGSELTYYQVYIDLTANPINSTSLRIVNESSGNVVSHWQETILSGNCTGLWFNATTIPAAVWLNKTYYIYYGNAGVASGWDGDTTFESFDDFNRSNENPPTGWTIGTGQYEVLSNELHTVIDGARAVLNESSGTTVSKVLEFKGKVVNTGAPDDILQILFGWTEIDTGYVLNVVYHEDSSLGFGLYKRPDSWSAIAVDTWANDQAWHDYKIIWTSGNVKAYRDNVLGINHNTIIATGHVGVRSWGTGGYYDNFRVRKYTTNPPTCAFGTEETVFIPPIPINLDYSKGFFWVNHTWNAGVGNVTDSYNILHNNIWYNETINTYYNSGDIGDGGYSEILIYAYNNSSFLSEGYVTQNISAPPYTPPPAPINLQYTKGEYWVNHTWDEGLDGFTNSYNISHNESWTNGSSNTYFNSGEVGRNGVSTIIVYAYNGILSEEYIIQTISTKPGIGYDQKISDSNIQLFFFPVMFFLLIMILVGGFKYVYK